MMGELGFDLRHTMRVLARSPGFALVAVLSLALGIGANTAMFGVVETLLLAPMTVDEPEELVIVGWRHDSNPRTSNVGSTNYPAPDGGESYRSNFSYPTFTTLGSAAPDGVDLFAFAFVRGMSVALADQPAFLAGGLLADGRYFGALRPPMELGRPLTEADDAPGAPAVAVLGHRFWMRTFGGDPDVVGRTIRVNGASAEIVGVTGEGFRGLSMGGFFPQADITVPLVAQPFVHPRLADGVSLFSSEEVLWLRLMARISPEADRDAARGALEAALRGVPGPLAEAEGVPYVEFFAGAQGAQPINPERARLLWFLMGVVGIVLLIACVNLAGLMLARGVSRQREVAVRRALGASRPRLVRTVLLESLVLTALGTLGGLGLVLAVDDLLSALLTGSLGFGALGSLDIAVEIDPLLLAVTAATGAAATLFFGLLPALRLSNIDPGSWMASRTAAASNPKLTLGRVLVAVQVGISLPLVVGASLFLQTIGNLGDVELGFDPVGVASFPVDPSYTTRPESETPLLYQEVLAAVQEVPGVRSATLMENVPLSGIVSNGVIDVEGRRVVLFRNAIGPALLETIGMRLIEGRMPGLQDGPDAPRVGVVNETAVEAIFGGGSPLGRQMEVGSQQITVIGVINDAPYRNRRSVVPATLYESAFQRSGFGGHDVIVRTDVPIALVEADIREAVRRVDADLPVPRIRTQTEVIAQETARERVFTQLLTLFGGFALFLAAIGLHGITSYSVTRRTAEIGVRVAVGARPGQILWMILRQVVVLAAIGLTVGVPLSLWAAPVAGTLLYGVSPTDVLSIAAGAVAMVAVAGVAGLLPAARAARLDPSRALGAE